MESSFLTQIMLPAALAIIMFGMGLGLTKQDFLRLLEIPRGVFVGLFGQLILLPVIAYLVATAFNLNAALAIGLMILAACPGGTMSNVISHLARANLALSVTLTAITTVVCVFSTPFIIRWSIGHFSDQPVASFSLLSTTVGLFVITLVPVLIGIIVRAYVPSFAIKYEEVFRRFSAIFMLFMITAILIQERDLLVSSFSQVAGATIGLNLGAIFTGLGLAKLFRLNAIDGATLGIEVGIQNATMAILIAVTFLEVPAYATAAGVYGITMYLCAVVPVWVARRGRASLTPA